MPLPSFAHPGIDTLLAASSAAAAAPSHAEQYPNKPVRLIVPFAPGGGTDTLARMIAQRLGEALGETMVVDQDRQACRHEGRIERQSRQDRCR